MTGKPQTLSKGQEDHVTRILRNKLLAWVLIGFAILAGLTGASLWGIMKRTEKKMEALVEKQFEEPRIQVVVSNAAAQRASTLMSQQIAPEVETFKNEIADQLSEIGRLVEATRLLKEKSVAHEKAIQDVLTALETRLSEVSSELKKAELMRADLKEIGDFTMLVVRAMGDDAEALDDLAIGVNDQNFRFRNSARDVMLSVQADFFGPNAPAFTVIPAEVAEMAKKADVSRLKALCGMASGIYDAHLVHIIWDRTDLFKFEKLDILAHILTHTRSITARATAGKHFAKESGRWFGHLRTEEWLDWWSENRARIKAECVKKNAEQDESTVPSEAAPSASSDVR